MTVAITAGIHVHARATRRTSKNYSRQLTVSSAKVLMPTLREEFLMAKKPGKATVRIAVFQHDWIPGFAAYHPSGRLNRRAERHVVLNLGSFLSAVETKELDPKDLPYMVAETLMHEVVHALEDWAGREFSEKRVEQLLDAYRAKYGRPTIWQADPGAKARNRRPR